MQISITPVPKVQAYIVHHSFTLQDLMDEVNGSIRNGWSPIGGPFIYSDFQNNAKLAQAMVLYSENK